MRPVTLAAALIVKNEERFLPGCLESLKGVVDEVVVYDTGSTDATVEIAKAAGARVQLGHWDGDFSRARNQALKMARSAWVLSIDADERVHADAPRLKRQLAKVPQLDWVIVRIHNVAGAYGQGYEHPAPRLLHRGRVAWVDRLHERPRRLDGRPGNVLDCEPEILRLDHLGYAAGEQLAEKSRRNVEIAQAQLDAVVAGGSVDDEALAHVLVNLGRSRRGAGDLQGAVDALEVLRRTPAGSGPWLEGTRELADILAEHGPYEAALVLCDELDAHRVHRSGTDWIRAKAMTMLGERAQALQLVRGIGQEHVDAVGRTLPVTPILDLQVRLAAHFGQRDEAVAALIVLMGRYGDVNGRGQTLLHLWGDRPAGPLAELLASVDRPGGLAATATELASCPEPGPTVAALLREAAGCDAEPATTARPVAAGGR